MSRRIPNHFHFVFGLKKQTEAFHLIHYLCLESCLQINKPERIYFYYRYKPYGRYWDMIAEKLILVEVELVPKVSAWKYSDLYLQKNFSYAHHSDFIRLKELNEKGGVYADIDTLFVEPLPERIFEAPFVIGEEPPLACRTSGVMQRSLCNALMAAAPASQFGTHYANSMADAFDGSWSNHSCRLAAELSERFPESVHIEPQTSFYKHPWTKEGINSLLVDCDPDYQGVYSMHLWAHLWWSKRRRDFSTFHAGKMTEEYIRKVDTTYNVIARRFLPAQKKSWSLTRGIRTLFLPRDLYPRGPLPGDSAPLKAARSSGNGTGSRSPTT